jgi:Ca-activated chloride channel family protein
MNARAMVIVRTLFAASGAALLALAAPLSAQSAWDAGGEPSVMVVPEQRVFALGGAPSAVSISSVEAGITIIGQVATTELKLSLRNNGSRAEQAQLLVPVPDGAAVRGFDYQGSAKAPTARLLDRDRARDEYQAIVSRVRDPGLLEFSGQGLIQSSVFPVPPGGTQTVRVTYEQVLARHGVRIDYVLPRSQLASYAGVPWKIGVRVQGDQPVTTIYSPSHETHTLRLKPNQVFVELTEEARRTAGPFVLSYVLGDGKPGDVAGSVLSCPENGGPGGHFLLLCGAPAQDPKSTVSREVTLVLDRSGSMAGGKLDQARAAALQVVQGLQPWEAFNIIDYSDAVARFEAEPVLRSDENLERARKYLQGLVAEGGTNIHDALVTAATQPVHAGFLPVILFLTDGLPTVGISDEARIRADFVTANAHARRLFTFGVGDDVNAPLLDGLAAATRATSTYVLPKEDVEVKVGEVYRRLFGPVLTEPRLIALGADGNEDTQALRQVLPTALPDLYSDDQLVVLGRYLQAQPVKLRLYGNTAQGVHSWDFTLDPAQGSRDLAFVPRLWASREIASLVDEVRQAGAKPGQMPADERMKEVVSEIVALSTQYGVLTEYTAFMATEGTDLSDTSKLHDRVRAALAGRAAGDRTGRGAVSQAVNLRRMQGAHQDRKSSYLDKNQHRIEVSSVLQVDDLTLFRIGPRWVDGRLIAQSQAERAAQITLPKGAPAAAVAARDAGLNHAPTAPTADAPPPLLAAPGINYDTIDFGTPEYFKLADRLAAEHRPGVLALRAELYLLVGDRPTLVHAPPPTAPAPAKSGS